MATLYHMHDILFRYWGCGKFHINSPLHMQLHFKPHLRAIQTRNGANMDWTNTLIHGMDQTIEGVVVGVVKS